MSQIITWDFFKIGLNSEEMELFDVALIINFSNKFVSVSFQDIIRFLLTKFIKVYGINVEVNIKPIYLNII